jgi:hypothetical protein
MNERHLCPSCDSHVPMDFIWPSPHPDPEIEAIIGKFQECHICGWQGDVLTNTRYEIYRVKEILYVDGVSYSADKAGIAKWIRSLNK